MQVVPVCVNGQTEEPEKQETKQEKERKATEVSTIPATEAADNPMGCFFLAPHSMETPDQEMESVSAPSSFGDHNSARIEVAVTNIMNAGCKIPNIKKRIASSLWSSGIGTGQDSSVTSLNDHSSGFINVSRSKCGSQKSETEAAVTSSVYAKSDPIANRMNTNFVTDSAPPVKPMPFLMTKSAEEQTAANCQLGFVPLQPGDAVEPEDIVLHCQRIKTIYEGNIFWSYTYNRIIEYSLSVH